MPPAFLPAATARLQQRTSLNVAKVADKTVRQLTTIMIHRVHKIKLQWLLRLVRHCILIIGPKLWPSNHLDSNPDYKVWGHRKEKICHTPVKETWTI